MLGGLEAVRSLDTTNYEVSRIEEAIARIIFHAPDIIIFDEATSALDSQNEAEVQKMLEATFADRTVITIAHRLTTLRNSHRILVFAEGHIAQEGTFKKLANARGIFKTFLKQK